MSEKGFNYDLSSYDGRQLDDYGLDVYEAQKAQDQLHNRSKEESEGEERGKIYVDFDELKADLQGRGLKVRIWGKGFDSEYSRSSNTTVCLGLKDDPGHCVRAEVWGIEENKVILSVHSHSKDRGKSEWITDIDITPKNINQWKIEIIGK